MNAIRFGLVITWCAYMWFVLNHTQDFNSILDNAIGMAITLFIACVILALLRNLIFGKPKPSAPLIVHVYHHGPSDAEQKEGEHKEPTFD